VTLLTFLVDHAEATLILSALVAYGSWRVIREGRVIDEAQQLVLARKATPDRWAQ
jgi:hypothetical protein